MAKLTADELTAVHDQLAWIVTEVAKCRAEVGSPSALTRIDAARRRAIIVLDEVLDGLGGQAAL